MRVGFYVRIIFMMFDDNDDTKKASFNIDNILA